MADLVVDLFAGGGGAQHFTPPDTFEANEAWGANCGPCALAAFAGKRVMEIRPAILGFRGTMNPTQVSSALWNLGYQVRRLKDPCDTQGGLAHLFWTGPWSLGLARAQYRRSHWVAYRGPWSPGVSVYDCNAGAGGGWLSLELWETLVLPQILPRKGTGYRVNVWVEGLR